MIIKTSLTTNTKTDTGISTTCVEVNSWTSTNKPTQIGDGVDIEMSLIECGKGHPASAIPATITKVSFQTVYATKTFLIGKLSTITLTTTDANTDSIVLCTCSKGKAHDCDQNKQYFLHNCKDLVNNWVLFTRQK